ncbi:hypothetical protein B14911_10777 [Bacillus sp. NRRL B-14911]|nr:hypothetical protein B14911_10777 [Bacillus sp. NRRL B-14911]
MKFAIIVIPYLMIQLHPGSNSSQTAKGVPSMDLLCFEPFMFLSCKFPFIVIYKNPSDYPGKYVARLFDLTQPTKYFIARDSHQEIKLVIPSYMNKLERNQFNDPVIIETWI